MTDDKLCGDCRHWLPWEEQPYRCRQGDCEKMPAGKLLTVDGVTYDYEGYSFEDECYDDCFNCFEPKEENE